MIDWISAIIPLNHSELIGDGEVISINGDGDIDWCTPKRLRIEGSYSSVIQVSTHKKETVLSNNGSTLHRSIRFEGNPIKFLQGHNVYGSGDLIGLMHDVLMKIFKHLNIVPSHCEYLGIKRGNYRLTRVDCTDMLDFKDNVSVNAFLYRLGNTGTYKHRGNATTSSGTVYFGQKSTYYAIKFYNKSEELKKHKISVSMEFSKAVTQWAVGKLRVELVLRSRELKRLDMHMAFSWNEDYKEIELLQNYCNSDKLKMTEKTEFNEELIRTLPNGVKNAYILWVGGMDVKSNYCRQTFYRHRKALLAYGIDISAPRPKEPKDKIIQFKKVIEVKWNFANNHPDWAEGTNTLHIPDYLSGVN